MLVINSDHFRDELDSNALIGQLCDFIGTGAKSNMFVFMFQTLDLEHSISFRSGKPSCFSTA